MLNFIKKLFAKRTQPTKPWFTDEEYNSDYKLKLQGLESVLGKVHNMVGHAVHPFAFGGMVDMYYFPNHIKGTGFATMELINPDGNGPLPNEYGTYELVAFTKHDYGDDAEDQTPFQRIERRMCWIFSSLGMYSREAVLRPNEACILHPDHEEDICLAFDLYQPDNREFQIGDRKHHLLLCVEVFKSELEYVHEQKNGSKVYAYNNGAEELFNKLKQAGVYPYSDLDRESVV